MAPGWCLLELPAQCISPKGLANLCPPGGTLRSPRSCCLVPTSLPARTLGPALSPVWGAEAEKTGRK